MCFYRRHLELFDAYTRKRGVAQQAARLAKTKKNGQNTVPINATKEQKHRIECTGDKPLKFVEVQTGDYFGEDDIKRYEDDYDRT